METGVHKSCLWQDKGSSAAAQPEWESQWYEQRVANDWSVGNSRSQEAWQNSEDSEDKRSNLSAYLCLVYNIRIFEI